MLENNAHIPNTVDDLSSDGPLVENKDTSQS